MSRKNLTQFSLNYKWWEYAGNKIRNLGRYEKYLDIPLNHKKYIYRQMQDRYIFDEMTEEKKECIGYKRTIYGKAF